MPRMNLKRAILLLIALLAIDQWSKIYIKTHLLAGSRGEIEVARWFRIVLVENDGMAWGTVIPGAYGKLILTLFRIVAVIGMAIWLKKSVQQHRTSLLLVAIAMIMAGALGNIIDSVFYGVVFDNPPFEKATLFAEQPYGTWFHGRVVDMLYFPIWEGFLPEWIPFVGGKPFTFFNAIFNFADMCISTGVGILLVFNKRIFTPESAHMQHG